VSDKMLIMKQRERNFALNTNKNTNVNVNWNSDVVSGFGLYDENETYRADSNLQFTTKR
jgi:hypothetical protein